MLLKKLAHKVKSWLALSIAGTVLTTGVMATGSVANAQAKVPSNWPSQITIGMLPGETKQGMIDDKTFASDLSKYLGIKVNMFYGTSYTAVIEAMHAAKVDFAYYGAFSYIVAHQEDGAIPMGTWAASKKDAVYYSWFIVPKNSTITSIKQLKGKTLLFADPASTSGHLIPEAYLIQKLGLTTKNFTSYFANVSYSGSHQHSSLAIAHGQADVAAVCSSCLQGYEQQGVVNKNDIKQIGSSGPIPDGPLAYRPGLPQSLVTKLDAFLAGYYKVNPKWMTEQGGQWIRVNDAFYKTIYQTATTLNMSPKQILGG